MLSNKEKNKIVKKKVADWVNPEVQRKWDDETRQEWLKWAKTQPPKRRIRATDLIKAENKEHMKRLREEEEAMGASVYV